MSARAVRRILPALLIVYLVLAMHPSSAQTAPDPQVSSGIVPLIEDGKSIYLPEQFARFAPQSAADMVQQIPGFTISNVSNDRGLGEASQNVLINGQRITGKGNDALTVLRRIPVKAVLRMEIMDGAMLDISGLSGHVLNVRTEQGSVQGNFIWRPQFRERIPTHWPPGEVNLSGKSGFGDFALGFRWDGFRGGGWGKEEEARRATGVSFVRSERPNFANDIPKLSGSLNHRTDSGSIWNLNASLERMHPRRHVTTLYQVPGEALTTELNQGDEVKWRTEIGSDYEFTLGPGRLKLVGFFTEREGPNVNELFSTAGGNVLSGSRFSRDSTEGERVGRTEYRWKAAGGDWSLSAEAAQNFVDATAALETLDANGLYQPQDLPGASSRVEEQRGESILSFSRPLGQKWSLQLSGGAEYSQLSQSGATGQRRQFWRPKGAVSLAWNADSPWELNLRLQRKVGQLNFFDFLASVDVTNNNTNGGNPELVPPQSWLLQLETVRSLGSHGKIKLNVDAERISDIVEQVPLSATTETPGNLPSARRLQLTLDTSLLLDDWGIPGGKLDNYFTWRDTSLRDPVFGTHREFNGNRYYWNVDFRQDVPGTPWTWGLFTEYQSKNYFRRLNYESVFWNSQPFGQIFLEHKNVLGLKVRMAVGNVYNAKDRTRETYYVARRDGPVDFTRDDRLVWHPLYRLTISGTF